MQILQAPRDPATFLGVNPREVEFYIGMDICMFIAALFMIAQTGINLDVLQQVND